MNSICLSMAVVMRALSAAAQEAGQDLVAVEVVQVLGTDPMPWVVELESAEGDGMFAFRVTEAEAIAIQREARGEETERPMSHALVSRVAEAVGLGLTAVVLRRPQGPEPTFGWLWVEGPKGTYPVSIRGGDAVAVALHAQIPVCLVDAPGNSEPVAPEAAAEYDFVLCEHRPDAPPEDISRVVSLKAADGRLFHFQLGLEVADSIWLGMGKPFMTRARIHQAIVFLLKGADIPIRRLVIGSIDQQGAIYGALTLEVDGREIEVDCRPSDGLAVALQASAPIHLTGEAAASLRPTPKAAP